VPLRVEPRRDRKLNRLIKAADLRRLRRGEVLFEAGESASEVFLVQTGYIRLVACGQGSREHTVAVGGPWELIGEEGMEDGRRRYSAVAGESASYRALDGTAFFHSVKSTEQTLAALLDGMLRDLDAARRLTAGAGGPSAIRRIGLVLLELGDRWGEPLGNGVVVPQRVTHQLLADLAGTHRSTVTTTLNDWLYQGILKTAQRGIHLAKPDKLQRLTVSPD
jgi:CRP/FNR family transcriptional regulator, cyclic AMP receptor protein